MGETILHYLLIPLIRKKFNSANSQVEEKLKLKKKRDLFTQEKREETDSRELMVTSSQFIFKMMRSCQLTVL